MNISGLCRQPFTLLDAPRHRWILVLFCTGFGIVFVNVFVPFNINRWSNDSGWKEFATLSGFGLIAGFILVVSQFFIRKWLGVRYFTILTFACWFFCEMLVMALAFLLYQSPGSSPERFVREIPSSIRLTFPGILIPYGLALLFLSLLAYREKLKELKSKAVAISREPELFNFSDEKGVVRFSVAREHVLYLESADNYVIIFHMNGNKPARQILRNSMKNIEKQSGDFLKRCHRSYMVNPLKIDFIEHARGSCSVKLQGVEFLIPVSRKFYPDFKLDLAKQTPIS